MYFQCTLGVCLIASMEPNTAGNLGEAPGLEQSGLNHGQQDSNAIGHNENGQNAGDNGSDKDARTILKNSKGLNRLMLLVLQTQTQKVILIGRIMVLVTMLRKLKVNNHLLAYLRIIEFQMNPLC